MNEEEVPNEATLQAMEESAEIERQLIAGEIEGYTSVEALMADLEEEDNEV